MTALEQFRGGDVAQPAPAVGAPTALVSWAEAASAAARLVTPLVQTDFVPQHFRGNVSAATAAVLYGSEVGMSPLQSLQNIYVISGRPAMYARTMVALVLAAGHRIWTEEATPQRAVVCGQRRGGQQVERVIFTADRARQAGYAKNRKYTDDPTAMLYARAAGECARRVAPDALLGMAFTAEELEVDAAGEAPEPEAAPSRPARRTAQRKSAQPAPPAPEPDLDEPVHLPETAPAAAPEPAPSPFRGGLSEAQMRKLQAAYRDRGLSGEDNRSARLDDASSRLGEEVVSFSDLTPAQAHKLIDSLEQPDVEDPPLDGDDPWQA